MRWYVGKGIEEWLVSNAGVRPEDCTGMSWWDEASHPPPSSSSSASPPSTSSASPTIASVPCQHWSVRSAFDGGRTLWTGFVVRHRGFSLYYSGDTAYCAGFTEIGAAYGPIDFCVLPIGAYSPNWFMKVVHTGPEEAVQVFQDVKAKRGVGVHWGTFVLSAEPILEPRERLKAETAKRGMSPDAFVTTHIGETITIG